MLAQPSQCPEALCTSRADASENGGHWNSTPRNMNFPCISRGIFTGTWASGMKFHRFSMYWRHTVPLSLWKQWAGGMGRHALQHSRLYLRSSEDTGWCYQHMNSKARERQRERPWTSHYLFWVSVSTSVKRGAGKPPGFLIEEYSML